MAIMTAFSGSEEPYHTWYVQNCSGYESIIDETLWVQKPRFLSYSLFGGQGEHDYSLGNNVE